MGSSQSSQMTGSSSSFSGLSEGDAASVKALISQLLSGGTADYKAQRATRKANMVDLQQLLNDYSNDAAFSDAADLMALNLQNSMEKQMPAIAKAVQGAGTSSSSMQALMSNKIAQDAALSSGALGAEQAKAYAAAMAGMQGTLENYSRVDNSNTQALAELMGLLRTQTSTSNQQSTSSGSSWNDQGGGSSGGGSSGGKTGTNTGVGTKTGWSNGLGGDSKVGGFNTGMSEGANSSISITPSNAGGVNNGGTYGTGWSDNAWDLFSSDGGTYTGTGYVEPYWDAGSNTLYNQANQGEWWNSNDYNGSYFDPNPVVNTYNGSGGSDYDWGQNYGGGEYDYSGWDTNWNEWE